MISPIPTHPSRPFSVSVTTAPPPEKHYISGPPESTRKVEYECMQRRRIPSGGAEILYFRILCRGQVLIFATRCRSSSTGKVERSMQHDHHESRLIVFLYF